MTHADTLIHARWIAPVEPDNTVLEDHAIAIRDGVITAVLPGHEARATVTADTVHELGDHLLIPGLINAHTHAAMTLMRGLADDLPLMEWLKGHIWPAEGRHVGTEFVRDGSELAVAEMLLSGTTCFNDMYFFPDATAEAAVAAGIRANVGLIVIDFPTPWAQDPAEYFQRGEAVHQRWHDEPLVTTAMAPHGPYTVSDDPLRSVAELAEKLDIPIHIHLHETAHEVEESLHQHGRRPLERLRDLGLVNERLLAVHATTLNDADIATLAGAGAHVVHCPQSNQKLASGTCSVETLRGAGINLALGTDGAASNNDLDLLAEMQSAALVAKAQTGDAAALPAEAALAMATLGGARALNLDHALGSLVPGKQADLVAVDLDRLTTQPVYHPISQLVYAAGREQVNHVWVGGRHVVEEGRLTTLEPAMLRDKARHWQTCLAANA
ncbi:MAG: TRZ/ATZ family hydrolase [Pseudomonadota bacterium]